MGSFFTESPGWALSISILTSILFVLLIREVLCWYFKINKRKGLLDKIIGQNETLISIQKAKSVDEILSVKRLKTALKKQ